MSTRIFEPAGAGQLTNPGRTRTLAVGEPIPTGAVVVGIDTPTYDNTGSYQYRKTAKVALAHVDTGGGIFAWANPETVDIAITNVHVDVTTKTSGACSIDVGTTAVSAVTQSDNLIDGLDIGTAAGLFDVVDQAGANGKAKQRLAVGKWVTASVDGGGASAGLVGFAYISYILLG